MANRVGEAHFSSSRKGLRPCVTEISASMIDDSTKEVVEGESSGAIVSLTFCDGLCRRSINSGLLDAEVTIIVVLQVFRCGLKQQCKSQVKGREAIFRVRMSFKSRGVKDSVGS